MMPSDGVCLCQHVIVRLWGDPGLQKLLEELQIRAELGIWGQCSFVGDRGGHTVTVGVGGQRGSPPVVSLSETLTHTQQDATQARVTFQCVHAQSCPTLRPQGL